MYSNKLTMTRNLYNQNPNLETNQKCVKSGYLVNILSYMNGQLHHFYISYDEKMSYSIMRVFCNGVIKYASPSVRYSRSRGKCWKPKAKTEPFISSRATLLVLNLHHEYSIPLEFSKEFRTLDHKVAGSNPTRGAVLCP